MFESKNIIIVISICLIISHIVQLIYQYNSPKSDDDAKLVSSSYISIPIFVTVITFIIQLALLWIGVKLNCDKSE
jgi:hypothetical protein